MSFTAAGKATFAAALQMLGALLYFRVAVDLVLVVTSALITFAVYLLNRFTDSEDGVNCPEQRPSPRGTERLALQSPY